MGAPDQKVTAKATVTNGAISMQPVTGVKSVTGTSHTVTVDVTIPWRSQIIQLRAGEPFVADVALLAFLSAAGVAVTAN